MYDDVLVPTLCKVKTREHKGRRGKEEEKGKKKKRGRRRKGEEEEEGKKEERFGEKARRA
jgi:hypothetical protein